LRLIRGDYAAWAVYRFVELLCAGKQMKIAKTPLESVRVIWTIYGVLLAIALQAVALGIEWYRGKAVDWMDVFPSFAAAFAVVFAVQGAVYAAAKAPKD
jgi:hypothetical protein